MIFLLGVKLVAGLQIPILTLLPVMCMIDTQLVGRQYEWLQEDLAKANTNRDRVPWVIAFGHYPMYCGNSLDCDQTPATAALRDGPFGLEEVMHSAGVDLYVAAHYHDYERMWPIYQNQSTHTMVEPNATVHLVTGAGGSDEALNGFDGCPVTHRTAKRLSHFGYSVLTAHNHSHLNIQFVATDYTARWANGSSDGGGGDRYGSIEDDVWLVQHNHSVRSRAVKSDDDAESSGTTGDIAPPTLDDLWHSLASFRLLRSIPVADPGLPGVDAGTRVVELNGTWYLFGRHDTGATQKCPSGEISINVRASRTAGAHWGPPHVIAKPDEVKYCIYADGSAFFDKEAQTWHYLVQVLDVDGKGGWQGAHFSLQGSSPFGTWVADKANPVIQSGSLWRRICAGGGKHCKVGMIDEGTFDIVEKVGAEFIVTFHGYDYQRRQAARGVARTADFVVWEVRGGVANLPGDAIFTAADCQRWNVSWAAGGCIGSGEASILRSPASGYMYQVIEAADVALTCDLKRGEQWWPLGLVRSKDWQASPGWQQMPQTPFVGGPDGGEPHVGCSIQYNSLHRDESTGKTYFEYWDVSFNSANKSSPGQSWNMYELVWGAGAYPIAWPGPPQSLSPPPAPVDCSTKKMCQVSCKGFVACPSDDRYYCCTDSAKTGCTGVHNCTGTPGLHFCACPAARLKSDDAAGLQYEVSAR
eukprot:COSAG01_NODE_4274_length_5190_cov_1.718916_5_plen_697_part_00